MEKDLGDGMTALHKMAEEGSLEGVALLFSSGDNIDRRTNDENTPLHFACYNGHLEGIYIIRPFSFKHLELNSV